ncbi:MAG: sortase [Candidatus Gracilibacteria bacterium]|nr:sortase [Candidatus Gracilibacteria bacterium]
MENKNKNTNIDILDILANEELIEDTNIDLLESIEIDEVQKNSTENFDLLDSLETTDINNIEADVLSMNLVEADIIADYENSIASLNNETTDEIKTSKIKEFFKFILSYITTSGAIFVLLLAATNYSAYFDIAASYLNADAIAKQNAEMAKSLAQTKLADPDAIDLNSATKAEETENKNYHSMTKLVYEANNENIGIDIDITPYENRIIIPKIGKNIPLVNVENKQVTNVKELEDVFMEELVHGVVRYPGSGTPGENGNMFIFGHSSNFPWIKGDYNDVFATLDKVVFNDKIIVYYNQKKYTYKIREKKVIKPGEVAILKRDEGKSEISLMTCYPVGTSINRLVVIGELVPNE